MTRKRRTSLGLAALSIALLAMPLVAGPTAASDLTEEAAALAERTALKYEGSESYRVEFSQESYWSLADSLVVSSGVLLADPPSRVSVEYEDGGRIVSRGDSIWVYVPQTNQFFSSPVDSSDVTLDLAALLRRYRPSSDAPFADAPAGARTIQLRPSGGLAEPVRLLVTVNEAGGTVTAITAYSTSGDRTTYELLDTRFNVPVPDGAFNARRPPGAELVRGQLPGAP